MNTRVHDARQAHLLHPFEVILENDLLLFVRTELGRLRVRMTGKIRCLDRLLQRWLESLPPLGLPV
jgi:hypothetical protein